MKKIIVPFDELTIKDVPLVGGKNASLGEMINTLTPLGVAVPDGFAITIDAFDMFLEDHGLRPRLAALLNSLDRVNLSNLAVIAKQCRAMMLEAPLPLKVTLQVQSAYERMAMQGHVPAVAVRSSATAEDSPQASFAGQHESYLNVLGVEEVLTSVRRCYASLFNDRAIKYRMDNGFDDQQVKISVGVQRMVRSDIGSAGVIFTIEPESGNNNLIYITGAWGLGESVVQGAVNTDEFYLFKKAIETNGESIVYRRAGMKEKMLVYNDNGMGTRWMDTNPSQRDQFVLSDQDVRLLGKWSIAIERHYGMPMDIEWAKDGLSGKLFIVQARPETIHSRKKQTPSITEYTLVTKERPTVVGKAVGKAIVSGRAVVVKSLADAPKVKDGDIIVADITNPDWNALLRKAIGIVTNKGGRTSHASIVARELGIPAVVGTLRATDLLPDGEVITLSCAQGDEGQVFKGKLEWHETKLDAADLPLPSTKPMLILADPMKAMMYASYPSQGVGLLRMEFMINNAIQIHPMALVRFNELATGSEKTQIEALTRRYTDKRKFFIDTLAESVALVAAAFYPREVIVRMSDFKTNEYARLLGGAQFEPQEENPMLGFRGASRYYDERYAAGFGLECAAIKKVRDEMKLSNVKVMIPFCRTIKEGMNVLRVMGENGLRRGGNGLQVYVMAEIPSNVLLAAEFAELFDGFSIGSNDLTQLVLGLDRDSAIVSHLFDENNAAVRQMIRTLVEVAHAHNRPVGLCGQAPSDHPGFAQFLIACGIDSISFNPDALIQGIKNMREAEAKQNQEVIQSLH